MKTLLSNTFNLSVVRCGVAEEIIILWFSLMGYTFLSQTVK